METITALKGGVLYKATEPTDVKIKNMLPHEIIYTLTSVVTNLFASKSGFTKEKYFSISENVIAVIAGKQTFVDYQNMEPADIAKSLNCSLDFFKEFNSAMQCLIVGNVKGYNTSAGMIGIKTIYIPKSFGSTMETSFNSKFDTFSNLSGFDNLIKSGNKLNYHQIIERYQALARDQIQTALA